MLSGPCSEDQARRVTAEHAELGEVGWGGGKGSRCAQRGPRSRLPWGLLLPDSKGCRARAEVGERDWWLGPGCER